jgi:SAM-dependent MidA family methyltransferase
MDNPAAWWQTVFPDNPPAVSWETFMAAALYHPEQGYYTRHIQGIGAERADFSTAPSLHPALGEAITDWALQAWETDFKQQGQGHWIEIGPGGGHLAKVVLEGLKQRDCRGTLHLVEVSALLREQQQQYLKGLDGSSLRVCWHERVEDALRAAGGNAWLYANELVDAFPCISLVFRSGQWAESGLRLTQDNRLEEVHAPWDASLLEALDCSANDYLPEPAEGQRIEIHRTFHDWLSTWATDWQRGRCLLIDYGDVANRLWDGRPEGTLRSYRRQERRTGQALWENPGQDDLTADVNFTDLIRWGEAHRWTTCHLRSMQRFMRDHLPELDTRLTRDPVLAQLLAPNGAGDAFLVCEFEATFPAKA